MAIIEPAKKTQAYSSDQPAERKQASAPFKRAPKKSVYGQQLAEKQIARNSYGLREYQMRRYFAKAAHSKIATGQALLALLETRLDNVVYRLGISKTRRQGRQIISHNLILVNGEKLNIPSYQVKENDTIALQKPEVFAYNEETEVPTWLKYDRKKHQGTVIRSPKADDLQTELNFQQIIEFYSR